MLSTCRWVTLSVVNRRVEYKTKPNKHIMDKGKKKKKVQA